MKNPLANCFYLSLINEVIASSDLSLLDGPLFFLRPKKIILAGATLIKQMRRPKCPENSPNPRASSSGRRPKFWVGMQIDMPEKKIGKLSCLDPGLLLGLEQRLFRQSCFVDKHLFCADIRLLFPHAQFKGGI